MGRNVRKYTRGYESVEIVTAIVLLLNKSSINTVSQIFCIYRAVYRASWLVYQTV